MVKKVSVITVNWNGKHHLDSFFSSLRKVRYPKKMLELILVDNGSQDGSAQFVRQNYPEVKVIEAGANLGFCEGSNWGIYNSKGEYVILLNNDTVVDSGLVTEMLKTFEQYPSAAAVGAKVLEWNDENPAFDPSNTISSSWTKVDAGTANAFNFTDERPEAPVDYAPGCAMMVKREVINSLGAFDPGYFAYYEDTDWAARMIKAGYEVIYQPKAMVWHRFMASSRKKSSDFNPWMMARNRVRFALKNFDYGALPRFCFLYSLELLGATLRAVCSTIVGSASSKESRKIAWRLWRAFFWNMLHLPATILAKRHDTGFAHKWRSYNKNIPLKNVPPSHLIKSDFLNVVIIPSISWYFPLYQRVHHFASLFARNGAAVLYIEPERHAPNTFKRRRIEVWYPSIPFSPFQFANAAKRSPTASGPVSGIRGLLKVMGLLNAYHWLKQNFEEKIHVVVGGTPLNQQFFKKFKEYSETQDKIAFYQTPYLTKFIPLLKKLGYKVVYDMVDEVSEFKESPDYFKSGEGYLLKNADLVITTARPLYDRAKKFNSNVSLVPNAVEYDHFVTARNKAPKPHDFPKGDRPVIGYYGAIWTWFDIRLLENAAKKREKYDFVLIGTLYEPYRKRLSKLQNVYYLGEKPYSELPAYLSNFDVATILFKKSKLTKSVNPVKVFEYLAGGKPVVSTRLPELEGYPEVVLVSNEKSFLNAVDRAVKRKPNLKKIDSFLKDKTWSARFLNACKAIGLPKKKRSLIKKNLLSDKWQHQYSVNPRNPIELLVSRDKSYSGHVVKIHCKKTGFSRLKIELGVYSSRDKLRFEVHNGFMSGRTLFLGKLKKGMNHVEVETPERVDSLSLVLSSFENSPTGKLQIKKIKVYSK